MLWVFCVKVILHCGIFVSCFLYQKLLCYEFSIISFYIISFHMVFTELGIYTESKNQVEPSEVMIELQPCFDLLDGIDIPYAS